MKKSIFFFLLAIAFVSCDWDDPIIIDPPVEKFTVTGINGPNGSITPEQQIVEKGGTAIFKITPDPGYEIEYLKDDGNILPPTNIYTVMNVSKNDTFEVSFKKDSILWLICSITWIRDGLSSFEDGKWIEKNYASEVISFDYNGIYSELLGGETYKGPWSLNKRTSPAILIYDGIHWTIETLNSDKMVKYYTTSQGSMYKLSYHNGGYKN